MADKKLFKVTLEIDLADDRVHELAQAFNFSSDTPMPRLRELVIGEIKRRCQEWADNPFAWSSARPEAPSLCPSGAPLGSAISAASSGGNERTGSEMELTKTDPKLYYPVTLPCIIFTEDEAGAFLEDFRHSTPTRTALYNRALALVEDLNPLPEEILIYNPHGEVISSIIPGYTFISSEARSASARSRPHPGHSHSQEFGRLSIKRLEREDVRLAREGGGE